MATRHGRRLNRLVEEAYASRRPVRWHRVIGHSEAELEERMNEMIASGEAKATDGL
jgi:hypothetical protein